MADKGPGPQDLIRKRITTDIKKFEFQIESQELEIMETQERLIRLKENIEATKTAIEKQYANLEALDKGEEVSE